MGKLFEEMDEQPLRFTMLPDTLPEASEMARHRYLAARKRMYRAQMEAILIAAPACWPTQYAEAKRKFEESLLDLFSQVCTKYGK